MKETNGVFMICELISYCCRLNWYFHFYQEPTGEPQNLATSVLNSTAIRLTWEKIADADRNGDVRWYPVKYAKVEDDGQTIIASTWMDASEATSLTKDIGDLEFYTFYAFQVAGRTAPGIGPYTGIEIVRTDEDG